MVFCVYIVILCLSKASLDRFSCSEGNSGFKCKHTTQNNTWSFLSTSCIQNRHEFIYFSLEDIVDPRCASLSNFNIN